MFANIISSIRNWFSDLSERARLIDSFNKAAKSAYINGTVPTYLKAKISRGYSSYRHQHSHWLNSGFNVSIFNGTSLSKEQLLTIGFTLLEDKSLVRRLVVLGFDTLEIAGENDPYGIRFPLKDSLYLNM